MSIRSMTGYGHAEKTTDLDNFRIEIKSVNARFREIQARVPKMFSEYEQDIRQRVSEYVSRGTVIVSICCDNEQQKNRLTWDKDVLDNYVRIFKEIKERYELQEPITLRTLCQFSDVIVAEKNNDDTGPVFAQLSGVLDETLAKFQRTREEEGACIARDIRKSCDIIRETIELITQLAPRRMEKYQQNLEQKIHNLASQTNITPERLSTEVAIMADKIDINEECVRLSAHIDKCLSLLDSQDPVGKQLNFLLQEMGREANTIGAKANDADISHHVVILKEHIEKMREHVQNLE